MTDPKRIEWTTTEQPAPVEHRWVLRVYQLNGEEWKGRDATPADLAAAGYVPKDDAATEALDAIAKLCGCEQWGYPGQVVRDVEDLKRRLEEAEAALATEQAMREANARACEAELERAKAELEDVREDRDAQKAHADAYISLWNKAKAARDSALAARARRREGRVMKTKSVAPTASTTSPIVTIQYVESANTPEV